MFRFLTQFVERRYILRNGHVSCVTELVYLKVYSTILLDGKYKISEFKYLNYSNINRAY